MKTRDIKIDIFKGLLVIGMIYCHVLQFFSDAGAYPSANIIINIINVITFPGFVFSFGYTSRIAYLSKELKDVYYRILNSAFKALVAFYISGIGFRVLVDKKQLGFQTVVKVLTLSDIPGWSEFLVSFTFYILTAALLFKPLKLLLEKKAAFWVAFVLLFFTTFIPYEKIQVTQIGLLIGTTRFPSFPILQYMMFYLLGMYFQRYNVFINKKLLIGSFALTGIAVINIARHGGNLPQRFPPSIFWLLLPMFLLYLYYIVSGGLGKNDLFIRILQPVGMNSLVYLLLSNIMIFALAGSMSVEKFGSLEGLIFTFILISVIRYFYGIIRKQNYPLLGNLRSDLSTYGEN